MICVMDCRSVLDVATAAEPAHKMCSDCGTVYTISSTGMKRPQLTYFADVLTGDTVQTSGAAS